MTTPDRQWRRRRYSRPWSRRRSLPLSVTPQRWRTTGVTLLLTLTLIAGPYGTLGLGLDTASAAVARAPHFHPAGTLNRFNPQSAATSVPPLHAPTGGPVVHLTPAYAIPHPVPLPMRPATIVLSPNRAIDFLGSDGRLEITIPAGAVTAADVAAAGGVLRLKVQQILSASGSNAGGSGHVSFGRYLLQLLDAFGQRARQGLRKAVTLTLHYGNKGSAVDIAHTYVVFNQSLPFDIALAPAASATSHERIPDETVIPASGAAGAAEQGAVSSPYHTAGTQLAGITSPSAPAERDSGGVVSLRAVANSPLVVTGSEGSGVESGPLPPSASNPPGVGAYHAQHAIFDALHRTLRVQALLSSPINSVSWNTDAPVATFGKPDPFTVDLNAGSLAASYPIDVPSGPGGLTPPVVLSYSSADNSEQHNMQAAAPWVGEGWNLSMGEIDWAERNVTADCISTCGSTWENSWQLSDPFGTSATLIPPNINVSTYYDDTVNPITPGPIAWHTVPETHTKIYSYTNSTDLYNLSPNPPCFRVWLPSGIMEEFGCTWDSLQFYLEPSGNNQGTPYLARWLLDLITDPAGNQIHITYQQDMETAPGTTTLYPRDAELKTIEYDSPSCHNAQAACSNWTPLMRINYAHQLCGQCRRCPHHGQPLRAAV
jgi:hypothetical protein